MKHLGSIKVPHALRAFLGTRRHTVTLRVAEVGEEVTVRAPHWDGGSKDVSWLCSRSGAHRTIHVPSAPWPSRPGSLAVPVTDDCAVIDGGTFRGKPAHLRVTATTAWLRAIGLAFDA